MAGHGDNPGAVSIPLAQSGGDTLFALFCQQSVHPGMIACSASWPPEAVARACVRAVRCALAASTRAVAAGRGGRRHDA